MSLFYLTEKSAYTAASTVKQNSLNTSNANSYKITVSIKKRDVAKHKLE